MVTGAGGFVGANLVRRLLAGGHDTVAVVHPAHFAWRLAGLSDDVELAEVQLADAPAVEAAIRDLHPDAVFHLAAHGAYSWQQDLDAMLAVNVHAMESILRAAGSSSEYGLKDHAPAEDENVEPNSYYAVTKVAATHLSRLAAARYGQTAVTLRLYSVYGPWEEPGRLMPNLVARALENALPPLVGPDTARDFVWVDDVCDAFILAATAEFDDPGAVLNVASGFQTTLRSLVGLARECFGVAKEPEWGTMDQRGWDTNVWVGDPRAAESSIGWRATTPLPTGLRQMGEWMQAHPEVGERYAVEETAS
jgi:nucleoside-diphosphate-sugar epimerase